MSASNHEGGGASKSLPTNMLDMPSMKDETARMNKKPEIRINTNVPEPILLALAGARLKYSAFEHVFHCIYLGHHRWIGVAGDGNNGGYEWFIYNGAEDGPTRLQDKLTHSDCGFGSTDWALKEIINKEVR